MRGSKAALGSDGGARVPEGGGGDGPPNVATPPPGTPSGWGERGALLIDDPVLGGGFAGGYVARLLGKLGAISRPVCWLGWSRWLRKGDAYRMPHSSSEVSVVAGGLDNEVGLPDARRNLGGQRSSQ